jgi:hypothetical protein
LTDLKAEEKPRGSTNKNVCDVVGLDSGPCGLVRMTYLTAAAKWAPAQNQSAIADPLSFIIITSTANDHRPRTTSEKRIEQTDMQHPTSFAGQ